MDSQRMERCCADGTQTELPLMTSNLPVTASSAGDGHHKRLLWSDMDCNFPPLDEYETQASGEVQDVGFLHLENQ